MWGALYIRTILFVSTVLLFVNAAFVFLVDPYDIFGTPGVQFINKNKYKYQTYDRISKIYKVRRLQPEALILGSSTTDVGLRPETLNRLAGRSFNLSFAGGGVQEANLRFNSPLQTLR